MSRGLLGRETPRLWTPPLRELTPETSSGFEAIRFAEDVVGLTLLPWQRWLLIHLLELLQDGTFRFRTALVLVARQQGKSTLAQVLALWRMYMDGAQLVIGTAQSLDLAEEVWAGAVQMAEGTPELADGIASIYRGAGNKSLTLRDGQRYKVAAANRRGGRGLSGDLVILDELREHSTWDAWGAVTKTTMARPRPQIVALSNAGDDSSVVLNHLRDVGLETLTGAGDGRVGLFEWSAPEGCELDDPEAWVSSNPSLGYTVAEESLEAALGTDPAHVFRTEVLCQRVEMGAESPLPGWDECLSTSSVLRPGVGPVAFGVDVSWDRSTAWITAVGRLPDGKVHAEVAQRGQGTEWVTPWLSERVADWEPVAVVVQATGAPASTLVDGLTVALGSQMVRAASGADLGRAAGQLFDAVAQRNLVHGGQRQLDDAARTAKVRPLGDAWVFDRKGSMYDVAPLVGVSLALWAVLGHVEAPKRRAPRRLR